MLYSRSSVDLWAFFPLFYRAFHFDHINGKCQWLSFDRNAPGAQIYQNPNYELYQKKGTLCFPDFPCYHFHSVDCKCSFLYCKSSLFCIRPWRATLLIRASTMTSCFQWWWTPKRRTGKRQGPLSCLPQPVVVHFLSLSDVCVNIENPQPISP